MPAAYNERIGKSASELLRAPGSFDCYVQDFKGYDILHRVLNNSDGDIGPDERIKAECALEHLRESLIQRLDETRKAIDEAVMAHIQVLECEGVVEETPSWAEIRKVVRQEDA